MSAAREEILARIARATPTAAAEHPRGEYRREGTRAEEERVDLFVTRVEEYGGRVVVAADVAVDLADAIGRVLHEESAVRVGISPDLPAAIRPSGVQLVEDAGLSPEELDALDGVVTTCAGACAETGTFALDGGPGQGRRALTLVPDLHVCVVRRDQVLETVPELLAAVEPAVRAGRPLVLVSGPSATSDIELARVEGVHGPRRLVVVLA